ncbi:MAG TPA: cupin domain-containing protein [Hyphomicrobium sp.]|nr:cupin domain-containing protein [Hyphomicrobium sp.]
MKPVKVTYSPGFHVLTGDDRSQAASMVIEPGGTEGGPENRHGGADQWLYVDSGVGEATINGQTYALDPGTLILIQRGDRHEVRNTGQSALETLNFYVPPAYTAEGEDLPSAKPA